MAGVEGTRERMVEKMFQLAICRLHSKLYLSGLKQLLLSMIMGLARWFFLRVSHVVTLK